MFLIDHYYDIDPDLLIQAEQASPRNDYVLDFYGNHSNENHMTFIKSNSVCINENEGKLLSFASIGRDNYYLSRGAKKAGVDEAESYFFMYFFTPAPLRGNGYGKQLRDQIIDNIKAHKKYKHLVFWTSDQPNVFMYQKRGARLVTSEPDGDHHIHYFCYDL